MSDDPFADAVMQVKQTQAAQPAAVDAGAPDPFQAAVQATRNGTDNPPPQEDNRPVPEWSQIPGLAASHAAESGKNLAGNVAHAVMHPIDTAQSLGQVGLGYMEKAGKQVGLPSGQGYEQYADQVNKAILDRYGSVDNFKKTMAYDPVGAVADLTAVLGGAGGLGLKSAGTIANVIDPLNVVTKPAMLAGKTVAKGAQHLLGERTGAGAEAVGKAGEAGFEGGTPAADFQANLRQKTPIEEPVRDAIGAMKNMIADKNSTYNQGMAAAGLDKPISTSSWAKIHLGIMDATDVNHLPIGPEFSSGVRAARDLYDLVDQFMGLDPKTYHTVKGLDSLKKLVDDYEKHHGDFGTTAGVVAGKVRNAIADAIKTQAPKYAEVMETYGEAKDALNQIQKSLSLPADQRKLNVDTALRKLQSVMRNNANTNWGYRTSLVKMLEENGAPNIQYKLAGQALSSGKPRGLQSVAAEKGAEIAGALFGFFTGRPDLMAAALKAAGITYATSTPRIAGEAAYYAGRATKAASKLVNRTTLRTGEETNRFAPQQARGGAVDRALRTAHRR